MDERNELKSTRITEVLQPAPIPGDHGGLGAEAGVGLGRDLGHGSAAQGLDQHLLLPVGQWVNALDERLGGQVVTLLFMVSRVSHTTFNCTDAYELSTWWKQLLDYVDEPGDPNEPGDEECMIVHLATGHRLLFIEVAHLQEPVGRVHLDLRPTDRSRDEEIERAAELGAVRVEDHRTPDGLGWMVLADPAGNRFCILRSDPEVVTTAT